MLFAGPSAAGAAFGYFFSLGTTYFFAFGVNAALYAIPRLVEPIAKGSDPAAAAPVHYVPKVLLLIMLGMLVLYAAALLL